jgi:DNA-binding response OmpR family regulator
MSILIALADPNSGPLLGQLLAGCGEEALLVPDGPSACTELLRDDGPRLGVIDCALPEMDGLAVCRKVCSATLTERPHLILLGLSRTCPDIPTALACGADDYVGYPVALDELLARVGAGQRILAWQQQLLQRAASSLAPALPRSILTLCAYCKSVRVGERWQPIEEALSNLGQGCSHTICLTCYDARVRPELAGLAGGIG